MAEEKSILSSFETVDSQDPEYVFDERTKKYWTKNSAGQWIFIPETSFRRHLRSKGKAAAIAKDDKDAVLSEIDAILEATELDNRVSYAGPLAGHWSGFKTVCGNPILVTEDPELIQPEKPRDDADTLPDGGTLCDITDCRGWPTLGQLIKNLLSHEDVGDVQVIRYLGYVAHILDCLYSDKQSRIIALMIAGERECGKTLLFNDIHSVLFGGKIGKPYDYMIGKDSFNDDFLPSVLLTIDDEVNNTHMDARVALGERSKKMVANSSHKIRGMHKSGFTLNPLWALTIMCNDEPANLMILPPLEEDNKDKFLIMKAYKKRMPMPAETVAERERFWATLRAELPRFVWWIRNEWQTPREIQGRFGVKFWHHPVVIEDLMKLSPAWSIWEYLERTIFQDCNCYPDPRKPGETFSGYEWMGTASDLRVYLSDTTFRDDGSSPRPRLTQEEGRKVPISQWLGKRLTELADKFPDNVRNIRTNKARYWHIIAPESDGSDG